MVFFICSIALSIGDAKTNAAIIARYWEDSTGQLEMNSLGLAYPDRIQEVRCRSGEWALRMNDEWYYWSHARLLPESERSRWEQYASFRFYPYPLELPPVPELDPVSVLILERKIERMEENPPVRHDAFLGSLFDATTLEKTLSHMVWVKFLQFPVQVHEFILEPLRELEAKIQDLMEQNGSVKEFFNGLKSMNGFSWRNIAGTSSRSYHSYGIAIDLMPKSFGGKQTYWRWAMPWVKKWWAIPHDKRWMAPIEVVETFEKHGFIWGGKWLYFDTMHFEYRPELIILALNGDSYDFTGQEDPFNDPIF